MMMPEKRTIAKARKDKRAGKAPSTQAGEFVHEEIRKIRRGEHGARSPQQAIAIGLSKARRAGVALRPPRKGQAKARTRRSAAYAYAAGQHKRKTHRRPRVSRAVSRFLIDWPRRRQQFGEMSPVQEYEVDRPVLAMLNRQANEPLKEGGKLRFRHLARRDLELPRRRLCRRAKGRRAKQGRA